jgi:hypothetical protein
MCIHTVIWFTAYVQKYSYSTHDGGKIPSTHTLTNTHFTHSFYSILASFFRLFFPSLNIFSFHFCFYYSGRYKSNTSTPMCQACLDNWLQREGWVTQLYSYNILYKRIFLRFFFPLSLTHSLAHSLSKCYVSACCCCCCCLLICGTK